MQAVILAAGKGTRLRPLTELVPKSLVELNGKPILEHTLDELPEKIDEVILVVGYLGDKIKSRFGGSRRGRRIVYAEQKDQRGTFHALAQAKHLLNDRFMILMGDDVYRKSDLEKLLAFDQSVLVRRVSGPSEKFGVCLADDNGLVTEIIEKKPGLTFSYTNCGAYKLSRAIFDETIFIGDKGEEYLSSMVGSLAKKQPIRIVETVSWMPVNTEEELATVRREIRS